MIPDDEFIIMNSEYIHDSTGAIYTVIDTIDDFKADGIWWGRSIIYRQFKTTGVRYGRVEADFRQKFTGKNT